jgi:hypothetical protein
MGAASVRVFKLASPDIDIDQLFKRLKNKKFKETVINPESGQPVSLLTTFEELKRDRVLLRGLITDDRLIKLPPDRERNIQSVMVTDTIPFSFIPGSAHFVLFVRSKLAEGIAYKVGRRLMGEIADPILSCRIAPSALRSFLSLHRHMISDNSWAGLNIPNLSKARLGFDVEKTSDLDRYDAHGDPVSVRLRLLDTGPSGFVLKFIRIQSWLAHFLITSKTLKAF